MGYGAWGIGQSMWIGADDRESLRALERAIELGLNFIDTALAYGNGHSEQLVGKVVRGRSGPVYVATKIPPKNMRWPASGADDVDVAFPGEHIRSRTEKSLRNLGIERIDVQQLHVWHDNWLEQGDWLETVQALKREGKIAYFGVSINDHAPETALGLVRSGNVDTVQVIYNIFDQAPEDELFPLCRELDIGVIARVPFDEGSLTGTLTKDTKWPEGDWRSTYFVPANLIPTVERADALKPLVPDGSSMPEMALRFILANPDVSVTIPGMRKPAHVEANIAASDAPELPAELLSELRKHRWDRTPSEWSQ